MDLLLFPRNFQNGWGKFFSDPVQVLELWSLCGLKCVVPFCPSVFQLLWHPSCRQLPRSAPSQSASNSRRRSESPPAQPASHSEHELCMVLNFSSSGPVASWYLVFWKKIEMNSYQIEPSQFFCFIKQSTCFLCCDCCLLPLGRGFWALTNAVLPLFPCFLSATSPSFRTKPPQGGPVCLGVATSSQSAAMPLYLGGTAERFQARFSSSAFAEICHKKETLSLSVARGH